MGEVVLDRILQSRHPPSPHTVLVTFNIIILRSSMMDSVLMLYDIIEQICENCATHNLTHCPFHWQSRQHAT